MSEAARVGGSQAPISKGADQRYWDALVQGRLEMPKCAGCGRWRWPAVWRCGDCGSWDQGWHEVGAAGTVYTWTRTWHRFGGIEAIETPFVSLVVEIDGTDGRRLTGMLEGVEAGLRIGARVAGRIASTAFAGRDIPAIRWRLTDGGAA